MLKQSADSAGIDAVKHLIETVKEQNNNEDEEVTLGTVDSIIPGVERAVKRWQNEPTVKPLLTKKEKEKLESENVDDESEDDANKEPEVQILDNGVLDENAEIVIFQSLDKR